MQHQRWIVAGPNEYETQLCPDDFHLPDHEKTCSVMRDDLQRMLVMFDEQIRDRIDGFESYSDAYDGTIGSDEWHALGVMRDKIRLILRYDECTLCSGTGRLAFWGTMDTACTCQLIEVDEKVLQSLGRKMRDLEIKSRGSERYYD